ncbi:hypothetical protein B0H12DRAFT_1272835 [Mycena haematopus]|nr:hypothetical protein B0H12DRAFT_1272835 [Mycena haematopus]
MSEWARAMADWLSPYKVMGCSSGRNSSAISWRSQPASFAACVIATYSASVVERETISCFLELQEMAPPSIMNANPEIARLCSCDFLFSLFFILFSLVLILLSSFSFGFRHSSFFIMTLAARCSSPLSPSPCSHPPYLANPHTDPPQDSASSTSCFVFLLFTKNSVTRVPLLFYFSFRFVSFFVFVFVLFWWYLVELGSSPQVK